jgi:serine/threonine protein kinase
VPLLAYKQCCYCSGKSTACKQAVAHFFFNGLLQPTEHPNRQLRTHQQPAARIRLETLMSPSDNATCPERDQLVQFLLGHLTEPELEAVERHLSVCPACGDTLEGLNAEDTLVQIARSAREELPEAEMVEGLIAQVRKLSSGSASGTGFSAGAAEGAIDERAEGIRCLFRPPEQPDELGRLADYRVLGHLGSGGMGVVFEAQDERLKRTVALKVLPPSLGPDARGRFLQEARAAAAIDHENVVTIYQVGEDRGLAFLAMQRLEGETLENLVKREGTLPADRIVEIGKQLALGLRAAHAEGLIHRDVKPANIWMEAGRTRVKLLDFGVARILDDEPQLTESGMVVGTPAYMSPEQAVGRRGDERSDLFGLGCVLYRLATGRLPFQGANALAMLRAVQTSSPEPLETLNPDLPRPLAELVIWLLQKEPDCRPQSADVVVEALQQISEGTGQLNIPPSPAATRKRARAARRWSMAVAALVLLGVLGYSAAPTVVRIVMNQGQLVIESSDPNIKIEVLQGGQVIRVVDPKTEQSVDLTAGEYGIKVAGEAGHWSLSAEKLTLTRGGKETIKVWREPSGVASGQGVLDTSGALTYDGKTLEHCLSQLKSERNPERLIEAVRGITVLGIEESDEEAARAIFRIMRVFGSIVIDGGPRGKLIEASRQALWRMRADAVVPAMLDEITVGNDNSREFMIWMVIRPGDDTYDARRFDSLADGMRRRAAEIASAVLAHSRDDSKRTRDWALGFLGQFCNANEIDPAKIEGLIPRFQEELPSQDVSKILLVSNMLIKSAPDSLGLVDSLVFVLSDEDARNRYAAIGNLGQLGSRAAPAVPTLVELLTEYLKPWQRGAMGRPYLIDNMVYGGGVMGRPDLRMEIIQTLGKIGPGTKAALPLLKGILSGETIPPNSPDAHAFAKKATSEVKKAIAEIEAAGSTLLTDELAPTPGGKEIAEVPREPIAVAPGKSDLPEPTPPVSPPATYDGKPFAYWLAQLKSERNPEHLTQAVRAMAMLADEKSAKEAAKAIFSLMRVHGSDVVYDTDDSPLANLIRASQQSLWQMPADAVIRAMLEEITDGNGNSRAFMIWMDVQRPALGLRTERIVDFAKETRRRAGEFTSVLLAVSRDESKGTREWALESLSRFCRHNGIDPAEIEGLIARFQEELPSRDVSVVLTVSPTLVKSAPDSPGLVDSLVPVLSDENPQNRYSATQNLRLLGSRAAPAVPALVELLTEYLRPSSTARPPWMVHNLQPRGGVFTSPDLRVVIIETLGAIGPGAKAALPLLEEVRSKHSGDRGTLAKKAISQIKAAGQDDQQ